MSSRCSWLRLLSVFVLCSVLFSTLPCDTVKASDVPSTFSLNDEDFSNGSISVTHSMYEGEDIGYNILNTTSFSNGLTVSGTYDRGLRWVSSGTSIGDRVAIKFGNYEKMVSKDSRLDISITGITNWGSIDDNGTLHQFYFNTSYVNQVRVYFRDIDGNYQTVHLTDFTVNGDNSTKTYSVSCVVERVPFDSYEIYVETRYPMNAYGGGLISNYTYQSYTFKRYGGFNSSNISIVEKEYDEKVGLLQTIINYVNGVWESVRELPNKFWNLIKQGFQWIVDGLTNLGNMLLDGIKNLFVPSQEDITAMQTKWTTLLEDRFGALYQTIDIIDNYANAFTNSEKNTITFPEVSIPLGEANFEFGGYEVKVVPDGFNIIFDTLKVIVSILATFLFVNAMKNRLEKLVGGSSNI